MVCPVTLTDEMQRVFPAPATHQRAGEMGEGNTKTDNKENTSKTYPSGIF